MGRTSKKIDGVFVNIVGNEKEVSAYDRFINSRKETDSASLKLATNAYDAALDDTKAFFETLARLEEVIIQLRIRQSNGDIKLSTVREYVYARTPFFRRNKKTKDVRVIVAKTTDYPNDTMDTLLKNDVFMSECRNQLQEVMDEEIRDNLEAVGIII